MPQHATFITQTPYYPTDVMQRDMDWISPGVLSLQDLQVTGQSPAAMAVNVSGAAQGQTGGNAWLPGGYRFYNDATLSVAIAAADATNPRIDLVVCGIDTTTTPYTPTIKVITGTPAATPTVPATPNGYLALAQVAVAANATSIAQANITDVRVLTGLIGDGSRLQNLPIPVVNNATTTSAGLVEVSSVPGSGPPVAISATGGTMSGPLILSGDPTTNLGAVTKQYADAIAQGLSVRQSVRVASTGVNLTLSGVQTIDGVSLQSGDRILVKDQTNQAQNGIYVVAAGSWSLAADANSSTNIKAGMFTFVELGTANAASGWVLAIDADTAIVVGTTNLPFTQFSGAGEIAAGSGLIKTGNTLSVASSYSAPYWGGAARTSGTTAPSSPNPGDEWYNTSTNRKLYWNGTAWVDPLKYQ